MSSLKGNGSCRFFRCRPDSEINLEEPLRYEAMTGLSNEQLTELVRRVHTARGGGFASRGRPYALGLFRSVALVVCLMRSNITQSFAGAIFGVSQSTVNRRWDVLRPLIGEVLAEFVPDPAEVVRAGTVLVDGTICPTWDWRGIPDLYSAKAGYPGMNIQIAATLSGRLAAVGLIPVHGARHDAHAFAASGLAALLADISTAADLGYVGVEGIEIVPIKRLPGGSHHHSSRVQHRFQQNPCRRRTRHLPPQDMAHTQRGRRPVPCTNRKVPKHAKSRYRALLLCGL